MTKDDDSRKLELEELLKTDILGKFNYADFEDIRKEVYEPLKKKHFSLGELLSQFKPEKEPLITWEEKVQDAIMNRALHQRMKENLQGEAVPVRVAMLVELADNLTESFELIVKAYPRAKNYYLRLAEAILDLSRLEKVEPEELVKKQQYRDTIRRMAFPKRKEAESFYLKSREETRNSWETRKRMILIFEKYGCYEDADQVRKQLPDNEALEAYYAAGADYENRQLDRIYGKKRFILF